jgi:FeS assembly SUF system protein
VDRFENYKYPRSLRSLDVLNAPGDLDPSHRLDEATAAQVPEPAEPDVPPHRNRISASLAQLKNGRQLRIERAVIKAVRTIYDPEIPVNIYELGLIYDIDVDPQDAVQIRMTLTAPGCPVAGSLLAEVERKVESIPEVTGATVELVWDPPWDRDMMSEAARVQLGFVF